MFLTDRRTLLAGLAAGLALPPGSLALARPEAGQGARLGPARDFSPHWLSHHAKQLASKPYKAPQYPQSAIVKSLNFDAMQKIRFRADHALWRGAPVPYPISFFHLNKYSPEPVRLHALENGHRGRLVSREIIYGADYFDYGSSGINPKPLAHLGFSGFRAMNSQSSNTDWLAFQGASYFRSSGADGQYGASARGIAINTALSTAEEFPRFSQFWLTENGATLTIYALLEGNSVTGAYKFDAVKHGGVIIDVHAELFFRADISRLGLAPLTSMYWYGENERRKAVDWRPEIHDSDGLALWTGRGERIWRPLIDPPHVLVNSYMDTNPKGFGLMQRDRDFNDYQDDGAFYNRRPGIWVEPHGNWGPGAVQLVEIPTEDETHDNIVAYWRPDGNYGNGDNLTLDYRLYWQDSIPGFSKDIAQTVATRIGRGGVPGVWPPPAGKRKFVIDFKGGALTKMPARFDIKPIVTASRGKIDNTYSIKVVGTDRWRAFFDLSADGKAPIDLRCYLKLDDKTLTETWLYQYFP